jgi:hypothetical protein
LATREYVAISHGKEATMARNRTAANDRQAKGIADPGPLADYLDSIDAGIRELAAVRTRLMKEVDDAFTGLRSSAQLFRQIFYGVELPIRSKKDLIERAGGPNRLIRVTYKETGVRVFALADVLDTIPKLQSVFPITSFDRLALELEKIREQDADAGATWFVERIPIKGLNAALKNEARLLKEDPRRLSILTSSRPRLVTCGCCGELHSPARLIADVFVRTSVGATASRWLGTASAGLPR